LWENATYLKDKEFGKGAITVEVEVNWPLPNKKKVGKIKWKYQ
jgi:hypothetical protein